MTRLLALILAIAAILPAAAATRSDIAAEQQQMLSGYSFAWGAQLGGSIDMTGNNMSSFDFSGTVGMRHKWIKLFGAGVGANIMASNSCRSYLVFAALRTDFLSSRRGLLFLDTRLGIANNTFPASVQRTGFYGYTGLGINLATGRRFASFITLGYSFVQRGRVNLDNADAPSSYYLPHLHYATVALGISF